MPQVIFAPTALNDLQRLRSFLAPKSPNAARRAAKAIVEAIQSLSSQPKIGRLIEGMDATFRELTIDFGATGYVARYHYEGDVVTILTIRHQREAGF
jgi:plasmid stabilization system protein ParE